MNSAPHPPGEECTVLKLAQVESDKKCSSHENQRQQRSVGLALARHSHGAVSQHKGRVSYRDVSSCAVVEGAAFQRVLAENLTKEG